MYVVCLRDVLIILNLNNLYHIIYDRMCTCVRKYINLFIYLFITEYFPMKYLVLFQEYESLVRSRLRDKSFATMVSVLQKFFNFMNLTASVILFLFYEFYLK